MKIIIYILFIYLLSISNSLPHFIYDGIESYRQCFDNKDEISFTIYGTLLGQIKKDKIEIEDYSIKQMGEFKCYFSENENSINEKRKHKIVCSIKGLFPKFRYIIEEPKVHGFDFMNVDGKSSWPKIVEKKTFLIGECGSKKEIDDEPILFASSSSNYSNPINKVRKDIIDAVLNNLPKRNIVNELKMLLTMKNSKEKYKLNEAECAYLAYKWIAENIEYDCYGLNHNQVNNEETTTYKTGKGVSTGISIIFKKICNYLGLEAESISGFYKTDMINKISSNPDYFWNSVKIDSTYYLVDAIWGAGNCTEDKFEKNFRDFYFCLDPEIFVRGHFPTETKWQLLPNIITYQQFENQALLYENFFEKGFQTVSPDSNILTVDEKGKIYVTFDETKNNLGIYCNLYYKKDDKEILEENTCLWTKEKGFYEISFYTNNKGKYDLYLYTGLIGENYYHICGRISIESSKSVNISQYFPEKYNNFYDVKLIEPLNISLTKGTFVDFKIKSNLTDKFILTIGDYFKREFEKQSDGIFIAESVYIFADNIRITSFDKIVYHHLFGYKTLNNTKMIEEPTFPETSLELPPNVLYSPLTDTLKRGEKYTFKIKCKTARKMQIFDGYDLYDLTLKENVFSAELIISNKADQIVIIGLFDNTDGITIFYCYKLS